jgi:hypothetical protein
MTPGTTISHTDAANVGCRVSHPSVRLGEVTDDPTPEDLEQLARSVAMSGVLGDRDRIEVVAALRRIAEIDKAKRRHPSAGQQSS